MLIDSSIGMTIVLPYCSFQAEIHRNIIPKTVEEMDDSLSKQGVVDVVDKISVVMARVVEVSKLLAAGDMDQEEAVSEISFGFIYAFAKNQSLQQIEKMRGLIGCMEDDKLYLNPCPDDETYNKATQLMKETAERLGLEADSEDRTPRKPTIH